MGRFSGFHNEARERMSVRVPLVDGSELADVVCKAVVGADEPISLTQIKNRLPRPYQVGSDRLLEVLRARVAAGRLYEFPVFGKSVRFWDRSHDDYARKLIASAVATQPSTLTEIKSKFTTRLRGFSATRVGELLQDMVDAKQVLKHPPVPGSKTARYATRPPDPRVYLKRVVEQFDKVAATLDSVNVPKNEIVAALVDLLGGVPGGKAEQSLPTAPPAIRVTPVTTAEPATTAESFSQASFTEVPVQLDDVGDRLIAEMHRLEPGAAHGALVSIRDLRRSLPDLDKPTFDRAVLHLADRGRVTLNRQAYPAGEPPEIRDLWVQDEQGIYYVGVALRS
jgi:hypothetical protein